MNRLIVGSVVLLAAAPLLAAAQAPEAPFAPEPLVLKQTLADLCGKAREKTFELSEERKIVRRNLLRLEQEAYLVPPSPGYRHSDQKPVYVVQVLEEVDWSKANLTYVFVLSPSGDGLKAIVACAGGMNYGPMSFEFVSINDRATYREAADTTPVGVSLKALLVRDGSHGNGTSQERVLLFRFNPDNQRMAKVFDQITGFSARGNAYEDFKSAITFKRNPAGGIDDLVVTTQWLAETEPGREISDQGVKVDTRESVFRWNGKAYEGQMNLPEQASPAYYEGLWKPPVDLEELAQPVPDPPRKLD